MRKAALSLCLLGWLAAGAASSETARAAEPPPAWLVFGGLSAGGDYAAKYAGAIVAPSGDLWQPGPRLRPAFGAGFYRAGARRARRTVPFASGMLLAGYQLAVGDASLGLYGGPEAVYLARPDPPHFRAGWHFGARLLAEAGLQIDERTTIDGHVAYSTPLRRMEAGARLLSRIAVGPWRLGPAAAYFHKPDGGDLRLGLALVRRQAHSGFSASAGLARGQESRIGPYLLIGFDRSF
jgi:hypothetical protein